ncbi:uncharacterized protein DFL_008811 [Arthrobotrys flagrans]|uniref:Casein kinase substrate phosphoprotein PP28 domain-containing protein n=1 Tax=Arthrobotrys flagrans TaxID=97331 RepID=A0A436ZPV7_ARTFL|nr:hypothetical protein DFL_008811 [Arthrobotrys flagrans]
MRKGKFSKPIRGGGKKFSRDVRPAEDAPGMWDDGPREKEEESEEESEEEESEEEESDGGTTNAGPSKPKLPVATDEISRDERRAARKALKEAKRAQLSKGVAGLSLSDDEEEEEEEEEEVPPPQQQQQKTPRGLPSGNLNAGNVEPTMSRREREAAEAAAAKERYRKLHEAGKTEEAKSDLARLALIRKEREEKAKQRAAELEEKKRQAEIKAKNSGKKMK